MKKIFLFLLAFMCGMSMLSGMSFLHAYATGESKEYLIPYDYVSHKEDYGVALDDVYYSAPFDSETKTRMLGASIKPVTNIESSYQFDRTFSTNEVEIDENESIFAYFLWNDSVCHDLVIVASDDNETTQSWSLSANEIKNQIVRSSSALDKNIFYGWCLVELPSVKNMTVRSLQIKYQTENAEEGKYANMFIYAPYVAAQQNQNIVFVQKQNFFNMKTKFGEYKYIGDKFAMLSLSDLFEYCYLGEIDYLTDTHKTYTCVVMGKNLDTQVESAHTLSIDGDNSFEYKFVQNGNYELAVRFYKGEEPLWNSSNYYEIRAFEPIYLSQGLAKMKIGQTYSYEIFIDPALVNYNNLQATSSDGKVATVKIEDGKLFVSAVGGGRTVVTLSVFGERADDEPKTYQVQYALSVAKSNTVNWWLMGGIAIFLIIASIVVYTIMVRRRLIKGRYPKY